MLSDCEMLVDFTRLDKDSNILGTGEETIKHFHIFNILIQRKNARKAFESGYIRLNNYVSESAKLCFIRSLYDMPHCTGVEAYRIKRKLFSDVQENRKQSKIYSKLLFYKVFPLSPDDEMWKNEKFNILFGELENLSTKNQLKYSEEFRLTKLGWETFKDTPLENIKA